MRCREMLGARCCRVIHRFLAFDRVKATVRKRHESANGDQSFDNLFVAIERIAEFARDVGADIVDSHEAPP
jgi:hypothetical protein